MSLGYLFQRGHSGDGCEVASTLCRYILRKGDLFVLIEQVMDVWGLWCMYVGDNGCRAFCLV